MLGDCSTDSISFCYARPGRFITTSAAARKLLGLPSIPHTISVSELRLSYYAAAKKCHPDVQIDTNALKVDFLEVSRAYDFLKQEAVQSTTNYVTSEEEELQFRAACEQQLGLSAEIVEECKQSPTFLRWLSGRTDAAQFWRDFFHQNGGLEPRLPLDSRKNENLLSGGLAESKKAFSRRKRR